MALVTGVDEVRAAVAAAPVVVPVGSATHREVGGLVPAALDAVEVSAPGGIVTYDPADLTVTVGAGTTCADLAAVLAAEGQECALDPRDTTATIGGVLATGVSGHRRLRHGPLRDRVLEVRFVTADGRLVKAGGPTVKNVSGFDLPRLLVGSLGTIGVIVQTTMRCQPRAETAAWFATDADPVAVRRSTYRPSCIAWDGRRTVVLLEGIAADVAAERAAIGAPTEGAAAPAWPEGPHRGRISVRPSALGALAPALDATGARWLAEVGVGTVHVAADDEASLDAARGGDRCRWLVAARGRCPRARRLRPGAPQRAPHGTGPRRLRSRGQALARSPPRGPSGIGTGAMTDVRSPRAGILPVDEDELVACVGCGLCLPHCPTYRVSGLETRSPRGRIAAMRAVELEGAPLDDAFRESMETCVQCRGCEAACPSTVPFGHLIEGTRVALAAASGGPRHPMRRAVEWFGYVVLLPRHALLLAVTWVLLVAQRLHLVPRRFGLPKISPRSLRAPLTGDADLVGVAPCDAGFFPGCVMDAWQRDVHRDALTAMRATGATVGLPGPGADCCGALHVHAGRVGQAKRLARRVIAAFPGDAPVVVDSAGCGAAMKDYGRLLGTPAAQEFSARVRDFSEWLAARPPLPLRDTGEAIVVQDPCHLRHVQRAQGAVRTVLAPAYRLEETADDALCCGAGGAYAALQPALAGEIRDRKVAALRAAHGDGRGALVVVSANPGCSMHLGTAGLDVRHPAELIVRALAPDPRSTEPRNESPDA